MPWPSWSPHTSTTGGSPGPGELMSAPFVCISIINIVLLKGVFVKVRRRRDCYPIVHHLSSALSLPPSRRRWRTSMGTINRRRLIPASFALLLGSGSFIICDASRDDFRFQPNPMLAQHRHQRPTGWGRRSRPWAVWLDRPAYRRPRLHLPRQRYGDLRGPATLARTCLPNPPSH